MGWKEKLEQLENLKEWDLAIDLMQEVIVQNPDNVNAYIFINYLLMNLLVEEVADRERIPFYELLAKKYFRESQQKFSNNAEYLYYTGITAYMSEWYFDIDRKDADEMLARSKILDQKNPIYAFDDYWSLFKNDHNNTEAKNYALEVLDESSFIQKKLRSMGAVGEYILGMMINRSKQMLGLKRYLP